MYKQLEKTEITPKFVKECLTAVKEGEHTKGDQDGYCWALYNKFKKDDPNVKFNKTEHLEMTELESILNKKLETRGHSSPKLGAIKINNIQLDNIAPLNLFLGEQIQFYRSVAPNIANLFRQAKQRLISGIIDFDSIVKAGKLINEMSFYDKFAFKKIIEANMRSGPEKTTFIKEIDRRM